VAITELKTGTKALSGNAEWSLTADASFSATANTVDGVFQTYIDVSDMVAGDFLRIKTYEKARSGDTQRVITDTVLTGTQPEPLWTSPSFIFLHGWDVTANCIAGAGITINWSIRQIA